MRTQVIAKRYARALFELAKEEGKLEECQSELRALVSLFDEVPDFENILKSPIYPEDGKRQILDLVISKAGVSPLLGKLLYLLVEKQRIGYFRDVVDYYDKLMDEHNNIVRAQVFAPMDLDDGTIEKIANSLKQLVGKTVVVDFHKDPDLIGGIVAKVGDLVLDGSVRTQLRNIKETLKRGELG